jgi:hypothetical protein
MAKNPFGKTAPVDQPYAIYRAGPMTWHILKTYKQPSSEAKDPYARWLVAAKSPMTYDSFEYGDTYRSEILRYGQLVTCTDDWKEAYK